MCSAYAGMIQSRPSTRWTTPSAPRECGDDPRESGLGAPTAGVLPANAGMIPTCTPTRRGGTGAPRECGDDPHDDAMILQSNLCSPRMRG